MKKKLLTIFIGVALVFTSIPVIAFGSTDTRADVHYVSLGDSTANGYGLHSYLVDGKLPSCGGYGYEASGSFASLIKNKIKNSGLTVDYDQLAVEGMRAEELHFLLDENYKGDSYLKANFYNDKNKGTFNQIASTYFGGDISKLRKDYQDNIADADLITYRLGLNNFTECLNSMFGDGSEPNSMSDIKYDGNNPDVTALINQTRAEFQAEVNKLMDNTKTGINVSGFDTLGKVYNSSFIPSDKKAKIDALLDQVLDAATYAYVGFCVNSDENLKHIAELNSDAYIVFLGVNNPISDMIVNVKFSTTVNTGFVSIPVSASINVNIGELCSEILVDRVNAYLKDAAAKNDKYFYLDTSDTEMFTDEAAAGVATDSLNDFYSVYEDEFAIESKVKAALGSKYSKAALNNAYKTLAKLSAAAAKNKTWKITANFLDTDGVKSKYEGMYKMVVDIAVAAAKEQAGMSVDKSSSALLSEFTSASNMYLSMFSSKMTIAMGGKFFIHPSNNGNKQIYNKIVSDLGSKLVVYHPVQAATCTEKGVTRAYYQGILTGKRSPQLSPWKSTTATFTTAAKGHKWTLVTDQAPEYLKDGVGHQECTVCHATKNPEVIPGLGPAGVSISSVKGASKSFTVKWKKPTAENLEQTDGYQVRYSTKSSMSGAKTVTITGTKTTSKTIKKLSKKKKYYVQVRTYKETDKKYYSSWSAKKSVTTK